MERQDVGLEMMLLMEKDGYIRRMAIPEDARIRKILVKLFLGMLKRMEENIQ